jgi:uncharacterized delta-60 repeat protein
MYTSSLSIRRLFQVLSLFILVVTLLPSAAFAAPGDFDPTFGNGGRLVTVVGGGSVTVVAEVVQSDGKVVAVGYTDLNGGNKNDFVLVRYLADGTLDVSFGIGGIVTTNIRPFGGGSNGSNDFAGAVAITGDGRLVVAGYADLSASNDFVMVRYLADGTLDTSFGSDGVAILDIGPNSDDYARAIAIMSDGRMVVAGNAKMPTGYDFAVVRYLADGKLDTSFGGDGIVTTDIGTFTGGNTVSADYANAVAVLSDGRVVVAGTMYSSTGYDFAVVRYLADGRSDTSFGGDGLVITDIHTSTGGNSVSSDYANAMAVMNDGRVVVAGYASLSTKEDIVVVRYLADGKLDTSFGGDGLVITDIRPYTGGSAGSNERANTVAVLSDGRVVVAGSVNLSGITDFVVVRYLANGTLDTSFGGDGVVTTEIGLNSEEYARDLTVMDDGRLVVAGYASLLGRGNVAVLRYLADGKLDTSFGGDGVVVTSTGNTMSSWHDIVHQPDGKVVTLGSVDLGGKGRASVTARYNTDGTLDVDFGRNGLIIADIGPLAGGNSDSTGGVNAVTAMDDGRLVMVGAANISTHNDFLVMRYLADGTLDTSFGGDGVITTDVGPLIGDIAGRSDGATRVVVMDDGRVVVGGNINLSTDDGSDLVVARYLADGTLDTSFGGDGVVSTDIGLYAYGNSGFSSTVQGIAVMSDGRVVVTSAVHTIIALVRYSADGTLDISFDGDGVVTNRNPSFVVAFPSAIAVMDDGRVVVVGTAMGYSDYHYDYLVLRYLVNGKLDTSFDGDGTVITKLDLYTGGGTGVDDNAIDVTLMDNGRLVVAGYASWQDDADITVVRYLANGTLDTSFSGDGIVTMADALDGGGDYASALTITDDGKLWVAGKMNSLNLLIRLDGEPLTPHLAMPNDPQQAVAGKIYVPILLNSASAHLAGVSFTLNYPEGCLVFNPVDDNGDSIPDAVTGWPTGFTPTIAFDAEAPNGELTVSIADAQPAVDILPTGVLVMVALESQQACGSVVNLPIELVTPTFRLGNGGTLAGHASGATITVTFNRAPIANDDLIDPTSLVFVGSGAPVPVLVNDLDPDSGTSLSITKVGTAGAGGVSLNSGVITFDPPDNTNGSTSFTYTISDGYPSDPLTDQATVGVTYVADHAHGDCNGDSGVNAGDFVAIILEIFDMDVATLWYHAYAEGFAGSPQGCNANTDSDIGISDLVCTVHLAFGSTCAAATAQVTMVNQLVMNVMTDADGVTTTLRLPAGETPLAALAFRLVYDPAQLAIDSVDADQDGIVDAVGLTLPQGVQGWATVDASRGEVQVALAAVTLPSTPLAAGEVVQIRFTRVVAGAATTMPDVTLHDLSAGNLNGQRIEIILDAEAETPYQGLRLALPLIHR